MLRDLFLQACLRAEYPATSSRSVSTSKIPKLQMLTLGAAAFTADHGGSVRARSLSALSQWPSLLSRQPARLSMWISPRRNARSRGGLSELRWVRPAFRVADWRDPDALRGAVLRARRKRIVADMPKGSDVVPRGLSSPPQPVRISPNSVHREWKWWESEYRVLLCVARYKEAHLSHTFREHGPPFRVHDMLLVWNIP